MNIYKVSRVKNEFSLVDFSSSFWKLGGWARRGEDSHVKLRAINDYISRTITRV